jgi:hypothetical protein
MIICVLNIMIFIIINIKNTVIFIIKNIHLGSADPLGIGDPCGWVCRPCREEKKNNFYYCCCCCRRRCR